MNDEVFSLYEDTPAGTAVGTVDASDADAGTTLTYAIADGNGNGHLNTPLRLQ